MVKTSQRVYWIVSPLLRVTETHLLRKFGLLEPFFCLSNLDVRKYKPYIHEDLLTNKQFRFKETIKT